MKKYIMPAVELIDAETQQMLAASVMFGNNYNETTDEVLSRASLMELFETVE